MKRLGLVALSLCMCGCSFGSKTIRKNYADYNQTVYYNQSQEMLLNLVRLKYREIPLFMKVGALSTSYSFGANASVDGGRRFADASYGVLFGSSYSEKPTITYTPIEGNTFVKQLLAETDRSTFLLLLRSGWPLRLLCHVLVERIGERINDVERSSYDAFNEMVEILHEAQDLDRLEAVSLDGVPHLKTTTHVADLDHPGVKSDRLYEHTIPTSDFQLRSFLDVMFFLGQNTQVPQSHLDQVRQTEPNGWIRITYHEEPPADSLVWVQHNDYFYSISKSDVPSKDTFALVKLLFEFQAGDIEAAQPVLTLSAN